MPGLFGGFHTAPLTNNSERRKSSLTVEILFGGKRSLVGALSPLFVGALVWIPFILVYILGSFFNSRFSHGFSKNI